MAWVADVTDPSFTDQGAPADASTAPLPLGALGEWAALDPLGTARSSPCVAIGHDPSPDPVIAYLYVAGGFDAAGAPLDTVERLDVTVEGDGAQTSGAWVTTATRLSEARGRCGGYTVDSTLHDVVGEGETWVVFAGGDTDRRTTGTIDAGYVQPGGDLDPWTQSDAMSPARAGFATASASDFLYAFGGQNGAPSTGGVQGELDGTSMPDVRNWNSLGTSLSEARFLPGSAQESAVIFVLGGQTDTSSASTTVDVTNY
jgi:hypothetical protein